MYRMTMALLQILFLLFHSTHSLIEIKLHGAGSYVANYNEETTFHLELIERKSLFTNASIHARIVSERFMVNCEVELLKSGLYSAKYRIFDYDINYLLQIKVSWLSGGLMDPILPLKRRPISNFLSYSRYIDTVLYNKSIHVNGSTDPPQKLQKPLCIKSDEIKIGRWVKLPFGSDCPPTVCLGTQKELRWLNDIFHFNDGFVWSPIHCNLRIFSSEDVAQCFKDKNFSSVAFTGDSLVREHFQNLLVLTVPENKIKLERLKEDSASVVVTLPNGFVTRIDYYVVPKQWARKSRNILFPIELKDVRLHLFDVHSYRLQASCTPETMLASIMTSWFDSTWRRLGQLSANNLNNIFYYLHPRIQFEDLRVDRKGLYRSMANNSNASVTSIACMTVERQKIVTAAIQSRLMSDARLSQRFVDGWTLTATRWESSWDGIHYSLLLNERTLHHSSLQTSNNNNDISSLGNNETCNGIYLKGSRNIMCQKPLGAGWTPIKQIKGVNRCEANLDSDGEAMYWCRNVVALNKNFHYFEGGVSRMLTNVFLNMACNS